MNIKRDPKSSEMASERQQNYRNQQQLQQRCDGNEDGKNKDVLIKKVVRQNTPPTDTSRQRPFKEGSDT